MRARKISANSKKDKYSFIRSSLAYLYTNNRYIRLIKKFKVLFVCKKTFSFPIYPELTYSDIDFMTTNLNIILNNYED